MLAAFIILASLALPTASFSETSIASWNLKRFDEHSSNIPAITKVAAHFDLIALQEVMSERAVATLVQTLKAETGVTWKFMTSHAIGRGSYKERYAFVWREDEISYVDGAVVYLDTQDVFAREPMSARFRTKEGDTFVAANIHVLYGKSVSDRIPEIKALSSYWTWLSRSFPTDPIFLMGDFNMDPNDHSFNGLRPYANATMRKGGSTLSTRQGRFPNLYDHIWISNGVKLRNGKAGILNFPELLSMNHEVARNSVSDHAPTYVVFDDINVESYNPAPQRMPAPQVEVRANKNSGIYHLPHCDSYEVMGTSRNLVIFGSETQAKSQGYRPARNCG